MDDNSSDQEYRDFLGTYGCLINRLATAEWTRREARYRMLSVYPDVRPELLDRALQERCWQQSRNRVDEPLSGIVTAASMWLALNELHQLGENREYAVTFMDGSIMLEMAAFMDMYEIPDAEAALVFARLAASMDYMSSRPLCTISIKDYEAFQANPPEYLRELSDKADGRWPASVSVLCDQLGEGSWDRVLTTVGMSPAERYDDDGTDRIPEYTEERFRSAIADFFTYCVRTGRKPHALLYGQWSASGARGHVPRPTLATIRERFGSWNRAVAHGRALVNRSAPQQGDPRYEENWVGPWTQPQERLQGVGLRQMLSAQSWAERGIGVVEHVGDQGTVADTAWADLVAEVTEALNDLPWNHFLTVEYEAGQHVNDSPYGQAFTGPGGVDVTLVSEHFLPGSVWPINDSYLQETGWSAPDDVVQHQPHWQRKRLTTEEAAWSLVDGLRHGRECPDPFQFRWGSGAVYREDRGAERGETSQPVTDTTIHRVPDRS